MNRRSEKRRYALFAVGAVSRTVLSQLPLLGRELGPVSAFSMKVAGRIVKAIQAGFATRDLASFSSCKVILICAPAHGLNRSVDLLAQSGIDWRWKSVLLCVSHATSLDYPQLTECGASVGSLNAIEGLEDHYLIEGGHSARLEAKRLVKELGGRGVEVKQAGVRLFEAARSLSGSMFTPLVNCCTEWFRLSGVESKEASRIAERMLIHTVRSYAHSGRRGWSGVIPHHDRAAINRQYQAVKNVSAVQAEFFLSTADHAISVYDSYPELRRYFKRPKED